MVVFTASILLLIVGIERVITGLFVPRKERSRLVTVGLGILVILIAVTAMAFPVGTTVFVPCRNDSIVNASIGSRITI